MIHMNGVLGLTCLLEDTAHVVILEVLNGKSYVLGNTITWVYVCIINHPYGVSRFRPY